MGVAQIRFRWSVWKTAEDCWLEDLYVRESARRAGSGTRWSRRRRRAQSSWLPQDRAGRERGQRGRPGPLIHGIVGSEADKERAEATVRKVDGVKSVNNLLQVVPGDQKEQVRFDDSVTKDRIEAEIKADKTLHDVKVASVNNGVVLLKGKVHSLSTKLRAVETAYKVPGVERVGTQIEVEVPED